MRCDCCDRDLNDYECSLKHSLSGEYLNTCQKCLKGLGIPYKGNVLLNRRESTNDDDEPIEELKLDFNLPPIEIDED